MSPERFVKGESERSMQETQHLGLTLCSRRVMYPSGFRPPLRQSWGKLSKQRAELTHFLRIRLNGSF